MTSIEYIVLVLLTHNCTTMLTIIEEKSLYFSNHTWQEFMRSYDTSIKQIQKAIDYFEKQPNPELFKLSDLQRQLESKELRRDRIGQIVANS